MLACVAGCLAGGAAPTPTASSPTPGQQPPIGFSGGAPSVDALLEEFLDALGRQDKDALHRLRVSEDEYTRIIVPGNVPKGQPPQQTFEKTNLYFWGMLNTRSVYYGEVLMKRYGGRRYVRKHLRFTDPKQEHDWYTAVGEVRLLVEDDDGKTYKVETGWIVEVAGQHKFVGFNWDD